MSLRFLDEISSLELEIAEYERDAENIERLIKERKVEAANDDEIKLKVMELMNQHMRTMDFSDPKYLKIIDILDERGRSLKESGG